MEPLDIKLPRPPLPPPGTHLRGETPSGRMNNPFEWLRNAEGGCVSAEDFCSRLHWSRDELSRRTLVSLPNPRNIHERIYPQWQIKDGELLPGLEIVVATLLERTKVDAVQISFFLLRNFRLGDLPLNALRDGQVWNVVQAAEGFFLHQIEPPQSLTEKSEPR